MTDLAVGATSWVYPRRDAEPRDVFTQATLNRLTDFLLSWNHAPGALGGLHLHACWNIRGVLDRRYHGQTTYLMDVWMRGAMHLADHTGDLFWRRTASDIASNLLFLQAPEGGFIHSCFEHEPGYTCGEGRAPIHHFLPAIALLEYAAWPSAELTLRELIRPAIDRHWEWFQTRMWKRGNAWKAPLASAGWCGVTNQDLCVVAALALYASTYGEASRYDRFGLPALEAFIAPGTYHAQIGLFERGDKPNFVERTFYNLIIIRMLKMVHRCRPHPRLESVIANTVAHLLDGTYEGADGLTHLAWGAQTNAKDKSRVTGWIQNPSTIGAYPGLLHILDEHWPQYLDTSLREKKEQLERTVAAYTFSDGTLPGALGTKDPVFSLSPSREVVHFWLYLMNRLGPSLCSPVLPEPVCIERSMAGLTWRSNHRLWSLERDGRRIYGGFKPEPAAIVIGPDESLGGVDFEELARPDVVERIEPVL